MNNYLQLLQNVLNNGERRTDRTGTGTISTFSEKLSFDLKDGFPIVTTKYVSYKTAIHEMLWILSGSTDNNVLLKNNVKIWNEWSLPDGSLGPIYGKQLRDFNGVDQLSNLVYGLKNNPFSRRLIVSYWNPKYLPDETMSPQDNVLEGKQALPPCHSFIQWYVSSATDRERLRHLLYLYETCEVSMNEEDVSIVHYPEKFSDADILDLLTRHNIPTYSLSCQLYCRSQDLCLGTPFNLIMYPLLTMMLAKQCGYIYGKYHHVIGDAHIYTDHIENAKLQLDRAPYAKPFMAIRSGVQNIYEYSIDDFKLYDYNHHPSIYYPVST